MAGVPQLSILWGSHPAPSPAKEEMGIAAALSWTGADSAARRPHRLPISRPAHDPGRAQLQLGRRSLGRRPVPRCRRQEWRRSRNDGIAFARPAAEAAGRERGWLLTA